MDSATWALSSSILRIIGAFLLAGTNLYLYRFSHRRYLLIWTWAWLASAVSQLIQQTRLLPHQGAFDLANPTPALATIAFGALSAASALLLLWGSRVMLDKRLGVFWPTLTAIVCAWLVTGSIQQWPGTVTIAPLLVLTSAIYIRIGITFVTSPALPTGDGPRIVGIAWMLWGASVLLYAVPGGGMLTAGHFLLAAVFELVVGAGLALVFFERGQAEILDEKARLQSLMADELLNLERMETIAGELVGEAERNRRELAARVRERMTIPLSDAMLRLYETGDLTASARDFERVEREATALADTLLPLVIDEEGLAAAIKSYCATLAAQDGIEVTVSGTFTDDGIGSETRDAIYYAVRELLANVKRHSCAHSASVELAGDSEAVTVSVSDSGVGFDPAEAARAPAAHGLIGLSRRLGMLGGAVTIVSAPGEGTRVVLVMQRAHPRYA